MILISRPAQDRRNPRDDSWLRGRPGQDWPLRWAVGLLAALALSDSVKWGDARVCIREND